jgi:hypothetical protein
MGPGPPRDLSLHLSLYLYIFTNLYIYRSRSETMSSGSGGSAPGRTRAERNHQVVSGSCSETFLRKPPDDASATSPPATRWFSGKPPDEVVSRRQPRQRRIPLSSLWAPFRSKAGRGPSDLNGSRAARSKRSTTAFTGPFNE